MWALKMRVSGAMMNPFEFRDLMNAAYGYSDETPEQVTARYKNNKPKRGSKSDPVVAGTGFPKSEVDKLQAMLANAKMRPPVEAEPQPDDPIG